jgi:hypothetical protein
MSAAKIFVAKAEECLRLAASAGDLNERSRQISLAASWHMKANVARGDAAPVDSLSDWVAPLEDEPDAPV